MFASRTLTADLLGLVLLLAGSGLLLSANATEIDRDLREQLRHRMEQFGETGAITASGVALHAPGPLQSMYEQRGWKPLWFNQIQPVAMLWQVPSTLDIARGHGLEPDDYHRSVLSTLIEDLDRSDASRRVQSLVEIELLATDALLALAHHLANGRVNPESIDPEWFIEPQQPGLQELVSRHADGEMAGHRFLHTLLPNHAGYERLLERLALKREITRTTHWAHIATAAPLIRPGQSDERVKPIRQRLDLLGDLPEAYEQPAGSDVYDAELELAVRRFQYRHGLIVDGIIGPRTLAALNVSPARRVEQLRANLERWRWLPQSLGEEYILVNIAGFGMQVISGGEEIMRQRVVVGQPYRRTPVFSGHMSYLVIHPSWEVPHKLAVEDQLPRIRSNVDYLDEMGFTVLQGWGADEHRIDPTDVDWGRLSPRNFPYRLRQTPGPDNALGRVKFMFPNRHNVYLHDTPARGLFALEDRALSSGCIRLENAAALAEWLLTERSAILSVEKMKSVFDSGRETTVHLDRPIPVHLLYWTAWVDSDGLVHFRHDIYERDRRLIEALNSPPPTNATTNLQATRGPNS